MIRFLEQLRQTRHPENIEEKPKKLWKPTFMQNISVDMKLFVVYLRYNKLNEPGPKWHTYKKISEIAGVKLNSVLSIV